MKKIAQKLNYLRGYKKQLEHKLSEYQDEKAYDDIHWVQQKISMVDNQIQFLEEIQEDLKEIIEYLKIDILEKEITINQTRRWLELRNKIRVKMQ